MNLFNRLQSKRMGDERANVRAERSRVKSGRIFPCVLRLVACALTVSFAASAQTSNTQPDARAPQTSQAGVPSASTIVSPIASTTRAGCFPFERLPMPERAKAEELLLRALDSEALYTIVGGIKPMSSGFGQMRFPVKSIDLAQLEERRRILAHFRCGDTYYATQHYFAQTFNGERSFDAVIFNLPRVEAMLRERQSFWRVFGITPNSHPLEVLMVTEHDATSRRNIGYGYLFGYPEYAVNFFAEAADRETRTGTFVERDFLSLPTFTGERRFVYAVPKGYREADVDRAMHERSAPVLEAYRERRARYIGEGKPGVVALLRDWFDDGRGGCSPQNAQFARPQR